MRSLVVRQAVFTLAMVVLGLVQAGVVLLAGWRGLPEAVASVLVCLVPGWLVISAGGLLRLRDLSVLVVLLGMGLRMIFVLAGLIAVPAFFPGLSQQVFAGWLVLDYLIALGLEVWLVVVAVPVSVR